jgi:predicted phosphodiesterase
MDDPRIPRRQMLIGTAAGAAGAALVLPARGSATHPPDREGLVRFGVIADVHQDVMHDGERRLRTFLRAMTEAKPGFILQLGDFCVPHERNDGFMEAWNEFDGPGYHVIGNHETDGGYSREQVVEFFGMPNRYYSFDHAGLHVIVLDGNDRGGTSSGYPRFVAADQLAWLRDDLASTSRPTIVFIHQPLDSVDGVDNRADVRALLEQSNRTPGQANVVAVIAGHSHVDYCRLINGIHYVMINSASYQWVGGDHHTCPYRDPLWAMIGVDLAAGTIEIEGRSTSWVGPSPRECGADSDKDYWGWDPAYGQPRISSWRFPLATAGDLGQKDEG